MRIPIPFVGGSYTRQSINFAGQRTVNWIPVIHEVEDGKWRLALEPTAGLTTFATIGDGPIRGLWEAKGRLFAVSGNELYEVDSAGTGTLKGALGSATGRVGMADNGTHLVVADGVGLKGFNLDSGVYAAILDAPATDSCAFIDQYIVAIDKDDGRIYNSSLADATTWDAADVATAEGDPDELVAVVVDHLEVCLLGQKTTEIFYNDGSTPFSRIPGGFLEMGCASTFSAQKIDNTIYWLTRNRDGQGQVVRLVGRQPQIISTRAVDEDIQATADLSSVTAYTYQQDGKSFYVLNLSDISWVYDISTGLWHERGYWKTATAAYTRHRADCHVFAFNKHLVGDYDSAKIYQLSTTAYDDAGDTIVRTRRSPVSAKMGKWLFWNELEIDIEGGVGLVTGQGSDPQIMLKYSDDGGHTWSNPKWRSMGKIGQYGWRARWHMLGRARNRVYEVSVSDPVKATILGAWGEVEEGDR